MYLSILSPKPYQLHLSEPSFFRDLNIDKIVNVIVDGNDYLLPFFYTRVADTSTVSYRQMVLTDLEKNDLYKDLSPHIEALTYFFNFTNSEAFSNVESNNILRCYRFLYRSHSFAENLLSIKKILSESVIHSKGLLSLQDYIEDYLSEEETKNLCKDADALRTELSSIRFMMNIDNDRMRILSDKKSSSLNDQVNKLFSKFKSSCDTSPAMDMSHLKEADHIENEVLQILSKKHVTTFDALMAFFHNYKNSFDRILEVVAKEFFFYTSNINFMKNHDNIAFFSFPKLMPGRQIEILEGINLSIALQEQVVTNNFGLHQDENVALITGPNQGGKTSYARMIGQIIYFAMLGVKVAAKDATLPFVPNIYSHFNVREKLNSSTGKLKDDILRLREIQKVIGKDDLLIVNEIYASTTFNDAFELSRRLITLVCEANAICICVTFIEKLCKEGENVISYVSIVDENLKPTFKLLRKEANGLAYAINIADKYDLTYKKLKGRLQC